MAVNLTVVDSINNPDNTKTVTVDVKSLVDTESEGDEIWFLSVTTNATGTGGASIDDEIAANLINGYARSSGLVVPPFVVTSGSNHFNLSIDGSLDREVALTPDSYTGDSLAEEVETQVRVLSEIGQPEAGNLSFKNAECEFVDSRFEIRSGTVSSSYTGASKSSVSITEGTTTTGLIGIMGYDIPYESEAIALGRSGVVVTSLASSVSPSDVAITVVDPTGIAVGDILSIVDNTGASANVLVDDISGSPVLGVKGKGDTPTDGKIGATLASGARVQKLVITDPTGIPTSPINTVDKMYRKMISTIVSQINFS
jgi:hypothetical protein